MDQIFTLKSLPIGLCQVSRDFIGTRAVVVDLSELAPALAITSTESVVYLGNSPYRRGVKIKALTGSYTSLEYYLFMKLTHGQRQIEASRASGFVRMASPWPAGEETDKRWETD